MLAEFCTQQKYVDATIKEKMAEVDSKLMKPIIEKLIDWLPKLTSSLWKTEAVKVQEKNINAELQKALNPKAIADKSKDIEAALAAAGAGASETILNLIRKEAQAESKRVANQHTRSQRKNHLGGATVEALNATESSRRSRGTSKTSAQKSNAQQSNSSSNNLESTRRTHQQKKKAGNHSQESNPREESNQRRATERGQRGRGLAGRGPGRSGSRGSQGGSRGRGRGRGRGGR